MLASDPNFASYVELLSAFRVQLFKAGDAAKLLGVPHETLGHWRRTRTAQVEKREKGWVRYYGRDLVYFAVIRDAQHIGYSHDLAREFAEYATTAFDLLVEFLSRFVSGEVSTLEAQDVCLIGIYEPVSLDGASLAERRKAWEGMEPSSGPQVRLFDSQEALAQHVRKRDWTASSGLPFYYTPTILRLVRRWMISMAESN